MLSIPLAQHNHLLATLKHTQDKQRKPEGDPRSPQEVVFKWIRENAWHFTQLQDIELGKPLSLNQSMSKLSTKMSQQKFQIDRSMQAIRYSVKKSRDFETLVRDSLNKQSLMRNMSHIRADDEVNISDEESRVEPEIQMNVLNSVQSNFNQNVEIGETSEDERRVYQPNFSSLTASLSPVNSLDYRVFKKNESVYKSFQTAALSRMLERQNRDEID